MRLRLFLRRLTVSAPRMAVRSALPWPLRWLALAVVFGFCAALALWAFEFGKTIAGIDGGSRQQLQQALAQLQSLRAEQVTLKQARDQAQSIANTADTLLTTQRAAQETLQAQVRQLELDNQSLREDLGFFEQLIPATGAAGIAIRGLQAELRDGREIKWQALVMQSLKNAPEFSGRIELTFAGSTNGKAWSLTPAASAQAFRIRQYGRLQGIFQVPAQVSVKLVTLRVLDGTQVKAVQSVKL